MNKIVRIIFLSLIFGLLAVQANARFDTSPFKCRKHGLSEFNVGPFSERYDSDIPEDYALLLEDGASYLLLETGDFLLLE